MPDSETKILVVDDDEPSRYALTHYLKRAGYRTWEASTGAQAMQLARQCPDLVLLDIQLPDMLGYEVCKALKSDPDTKSIPILHVSATFRSAEDKAVGLDGGADGYLSWPIEPEELLANVRVLLRLREADRVLRKRNERLEILSEATAHLLTTREYGAMMQQLFSKIAQHLNVDTYLNFVSDGGDALRLQSCAGIPEESIGRLQKLRFGEGICGSVAERREPMIAADVQNSDDPKTAVMRGLGMRAYVCNPLIIREQLLGTLSFGSRTRSHFDEDELQFVRTIAHYVAIALDRLRRETELEAAKADLELQVQKRTEKLREAVHEMESFTYSITHDMRAPLRAMQGFARILLDEYSAKLDSDGVDRLRRIGSAASRLDSLITDVLNYAKVVRGETSLRAVDLDKLIRDILRDYPSFHESGADVRISSSLPAVLGNEAFLTQIFSNLLDNAIKFVPSGTQPRVDISAETEGGWARICIKDNGIGIDPQHRERIFNLFERLHAPYQFSGTGVGLAIVRKAVQRLGGEIGVDSEPGIGSRFWIKLPLA